MNKMRASYCMALFLHFFTLTISFPSIGMVLEPTMQTHSDDHNRIAFLLSMNRLLPGLFSDSAKYDVNLMQLLDDQNELQKILDGNKTFVQLHADKKRNTKILIEPKTNDPIYVGEVKINAEAMMQFKASLHEIIVDAEKRFKDPKELLESFAAGFQNLLVTDLKAVINGIGYIANKKQRTPELSRLRSQYGVLQQCKNRSTMVEKFDCLVSRYEELEGLMNLPAKGQLQGIISNFSENEFFYSTLFLAASINQIDALASWQKVITAVQSLSDDRLIFLDDKEDALLPLLKKLLSPGDHSSKLTQVVERVWSKVNTFAKQKSVVKKLIKHGVELYEVPTAVAIFRGFAGGDCSSQFSFPYPNDPNERVFMIKNSGKDNEKVKGYVTATEVVINGNRKALYVITISGQNVSAADTELIFRGLCSLKTQLGVDEVILPKRTMVPALINFPAISGIYLQYAEQGAEVTVAYQNIDIRSLIESFNPKSGSNSGSYDHNAKHKLGGIISFSDHEIKAELSSYDNEISREPVSSFKNEAIFDLIFNVQILGQTETLERILRNSDVIAKLGSHMISNIRDYFLAKQTGKNSSEHVLTVQELKDVVDALGLDRTYLQSLSTLLFPGFFLCSDAFEDDNIEQASHIAAADIRAHHHKAATFIHVKKDHLQRLKETVVFQELAEQLVRGLSSDTLDERKKSLEVLTLLKPQVPNLKNHLLELLTESRYEEAILGSLVLLGALNNSDITVVKLIASLLFNVNQKIILAAIETLLTISLKVDDTIVAKLLEIATGIDENTWRVCKRKALHAAATLAPDSPLVRQTLMDTMSDWTLGVEAFKLINAITPKSTEVHNRVHTFLKDVEMGPIFANEFFSGNILWTKRKNVLALLPHLAGAVTLELSGQAEFMGANLGQLIINSKVNCPKLHKRLLSAFERNREPGRIIVITALSACVPADSTPHAYFAELLEESMRNSPKFVWPLLRVIMTGLSPAEIDCVAALYRNHESDEVRRALVYALADVIKTDDHHLTLLIAPFLDDPSPDVVETAVNEFWDIEVLDPQIQGKIKEVSEKYAL